MIIISLGNSDKLAKSLALKLKAKYSKLLIDKFPDGDIYLKYMVNVKNETVILVHSFQPNPNQSLINLVFAAETARDLGAKKVILVAPYLAFMRQDKRFNPGEAVSSKIMAKWLGSCVNKIMTIDTHLHRFRTLDKLFSIPAVNLSANKLIAACVKKFNHPFLMGPDWESSQWARRIANQIGADSAILEKTRHHARKVTVRLTEKANFKNRNIVIIDDIISTGHTVIEAAKLAKRLGAKSVTAIAVHGIFTEQAYEKLKKAGINKIVTANTILHRSNNLDVSSLLAEELRN